MIIGLFIAIVLIGVALSLRKGLDETLWHEANMFVTKDGNLLIFES